MQLPRVRLEDRADQARCRHHQPYHHLRTLSSPGVPDDTWSPCSASPSFARVIHGDDLQTSAEQQKKQPMQASLCRAATASAREDQVQQGRRNCIRQTLKEADLGSEFARDPKRAVGDLRHAAGAESTHASGSSRPHTPITATLSALRSRKLPHSPRPTILANAPDALEPASNGGIEARTEQNRTSPPSYANLCRGEITTGTGRC